MRCCQIKKETTRSQEIERTFHLSIPEINAFIGDSRLITREMAFHDTIPRTTTHLLSVPSNGTSRRMLQYF